MKKWNVIVDVALCTNCANCFVATKDEYCGNAEPGYFAPQPLHGHRWLDLQKVERGSHPMVEANFRPVMCNHCDDAPCLKAARDGAVRKRDDGIVIIDPERARGQRQIVEACPYGAVYWNEELQLPQAWPFDAHLLDAGWSKTRGEQACPTGALRTLKVTDAEMAATARADGLAVLRPELGTRPRVYYRNNHLFETGFLGGTVVRRVAGVEEVVIGATVTAKLGDRVVGSALTDAFGDFRIDRLSREAATVELTVADAARGTTPVTVQATAPGYSGCIELA